ncbi:MAG: chemotaxis protein CheW [Deltaproteobacteria bacterium]|nr:chemotaxis protein CheW [Deltaproteobacteria bacterium]
MEDELNDIQLACFSLGDKLFAVDIMRIREILLPQKLSSLPRASELLDGVINLRGSVIPVMNMRKRFSMPAEEHIKTGKLLIVSLAKQMLALMVDDVMEVITVPARDIKPPILLSSDVGMEYLVGVCLSSERVFMILNVDSLLGSSDLPLSNHISKSTK